MNDLNLEEENIDNNHNTEWVELKDPQSGKLFYANTINGECLWELPPGTSL